MAKKPKVRDAAGPSIPLNIPAKPGSKEPFTYVASKINTALAETAYDELQDEDEGMIPVLVDLTLSPMYLIARNSLEKDLASAATEEGRRMSIDIFASRMIQAGSKLQAAEGQK